MSHEFEYVSLYEKLREARLKAWLVVENGNVQGIDVETPSIQSTVRMELISELSGDRVRATFFPNEEIISIVKKQTTT